MKRGERLVRRNNDFYVETVIDSENAALRKATRDDVARLKGTLEKSETVESLQFLERETENGSVFLVKRKIDPNTETWTPATDDELDTIMELKTKPEAGDDNSKRVSKRKKKGKIDDPS